MTAAPVLRAISAEALAAVRQLLERGGLSRQPGAGPKGLAGSSAASFGVPHCRCGRLASFRTLEIVATRRGSAPKAADLCRSHAADRARRLGLDLPAPAIAAAELAALELLFEQVAFGRRVAP